MLLIQAFLRLCQYRQWYTIIFIVNGIELITSNNEIRNETSPQLLGAHFERFLQSGRLPYMYV